jgi:hypothetical protein
MRHFLVGIACSVACLTATCGGPPQKHSEPDLNAGSEEAVAGAEEYYTVRAGPVPNASVGSLSGTFQLHKASAQTGIASERKGGACLAFDAAGLGLDKMAAKTCNLNKDCQTDESYGWQYCDDKTHTCWAKPAGPVNAKLCSKGLLDVNAVNPVPPAPLNLAEFGITLKPGAKVRVIACLNKAGTSGCAELDSADRIQVMGPEAPVKP